MNELFHNSVRTILLAVMVLAMLLPLGGCDEDEKKSPQKAQYYESGQCCTNFTTMPWVSLFTYIGPSGSTVSNPESHLYTFTATRAAHTISLTGLSGNVAWYLYTGALTGATLVGFCDYDFSTNADRICTAPGLTAGTAHHVEVYPFGPNMDYILSIGL